MEQDNQQFKFTQQPPQTFGTPEPAVAAIPVKYAGFWIRWVANFIDGLVLMIPGIIVSLIIRFATGGVTQSILGSISSLLVSWAYFILMTNKYQATLGKRALGLAVISDKSESLSLRQIIIRETIGKLISSITLGIGYMMAGFTEKKQALHDKVASTIVIYKDPNKKIKVWVWILVAIFPFIIILGILASIVLVSLNSARGKAQNASVKSYLASAIPLAIVFNDERGSLLGFDPATDPGFNLNFPACSGRPIVNISPDGNQMAIFAKLCSDKKKYFCVDMENTGREVDEVYALAGKSVCVELPSGQTESVNDKFNTVNNNSVNSQVAPDLGGIQIDPSVLNESINNAIISNMRSISSLLEQYKNTHGTYKAFSVSEADKSKLMFDTSGCKSEMKIDISPVKEEYVIYASSCTDSAMSFCVEQQVGMNPINPIPASTALVEKTYHCK